MNGFNNSQKRSWSNLLESLINLIVAVSILIIMLLPKFLFPYNITRNRSFSFKHIMASLIFFKSVIRDSCKRVFVVAKASTSMREIIPGFLSFYFRILSFFNFAMTKWFCRVTCFL